MLRRLLWERRFNEAGSLLSKAPPSLGAAAVLIVQGELEGFFFLRNGSYIDFVEFVAYKWGKTTTGCTLEWTSDSMGLGRFRVGSFYRSSQDEETIINVYRQKNSLAADALRNEGAYAAWACQHPELIVALLEQVDGAKRLEIIEAIKDAVLPEAVLRAVMIAEPILYLQHALRDTCPFRTALSAVHRSSAERTALLQQAVYSSQLSGRVLLRLLDDIREDPLVDFEMVLVEVFVAATRRAPEILEELLRTTFIPDRVYAHAIVSAKTLPAALAILAEHAAAADVALASRFDPQSKVDRVAGSLPRLTRPKPQREPAANLLSWAKGVHAKIEEDETAFIGPRATEAAGALIAAGILDDCLFRILQRRKLSDALQVAVLHAVLASGSVDTVRQFFYRSAVDDAVRVQAVHRYCSGSLATEDAFERWRVAMGSVMGEEHRPAALLEAVEIMGWPNFVRVAFQKSGRENSINAGHVQRVLDMLLEWCGEEAFLVALQPVLVAAAQQTKAEPELSLLSVLERDREARMVERGRSWLLHRSGWIMDHLEAGNVTRSTLHVLLETSADEVFMRIVRRAGLDTLRRFTASKPQDISPLRLEFVHAQQQRRGTVGGFPICPWNLPVLQGSRRVSLPFPLPCDSCSGKAAAFDVDALCGIATKHLHDALQSEKAFDAAAALLATGPTDSFFGATFKMGDQERRFAAFLRVIGVPDDPLSIVQAVVQIPCLLVYFCQTCRQLPADAQQLQKIAAYIESDALLAAYLGKLLLAACVQDDNLSLVQAIFAICGERFPEGVLPSMDVSMLRGLFRNSDTAVMRYLYHVLPESFFAPTDAATAGGECGAKLSPSAGEAFVEETRAARTVAQCVVVEQELNPWMSSSDCRNIVLEYLLPKELQAGFAAVAAKPATSETDEEPDSARASAPSATLAIASKAPAAAPTLLLYQLFKDVRSNPDIQLTPYCRRHQRCRLLSADQLECARVAYPFAATGGTLHRQDAIRNAPSPHRTLAPVGFVGFGIVGARSPARTPSTPDERGARLTKRSATLILRDLPQAQSAAAVSVDEVALESGLDDNVPTEAASAAAVGVIVAKPRTKPGTKPRTKSRAMKPRSRKPRTVRARTPTELEVPVPQSAAEGRSLPVPASMDESPNSPPARRKRKRSPPSSE